MAGAGLHQARPGALRRDHRAVHPAVPPRATPQHGPVAGRGRRGIISGRSRSRSTPPTGSRAGTTRRRARTSRTRMSSRTGWRPWPGSPTRRSSTSIPGPPDCPTTCSRRMRSSTSTPVSGRPGRRCSCWPGSSGRPWATWVSPATPRPPASGASRSGCPSDRATPGARPATGWRGCRAPSARPSRTSSAGTGRSRTGAARHVSTTPRTRPSRRSSRRMPCARSRRAGVSAPIRWEELEDPELRPDRWDLRSMPARVAEVGDLFAGALVFEQTLPSL